MINTQWFEQPMSRTSFHGLKDVRAIEVRLYVPFFFLMLFFVAVFFFFFFFFLYTICIAVQYTLVNVMHTDM